MTTSADFSLDVPFHKLDDDERMVWGWASVATKSGRPVIDLHNDMIDISDLRKAVEEFMDGSRDAGYMHERDENGRIFRIGKIVDSFVITSAVAKALNMNTDQEGWVVGVRIENDEVWKRVKSGELTMFSIGGRGQRVAA